MVFQRGQFMVSPTLFIATGVVPRNNEYSEMRAFFLQGVTGMTQKMWPRCVLTSRVCWLGRKIPMPGFRFSYGSAGGIRRLLGVRGAAGNLDGAAQMIGFWKRTKQVHTWGSSSIQALGAS